MISVYLLLDLCEEGEVRRCSSFCGAGTVAHFGVQHCSSLCSQSEGDDFLAGFAG